MPHGLGYALDSQIVSQLTPKWVEALSEDRVVGVTLGYCGFTLAVTDAGAIFSFGRNQKGVLGHGSLEDEVLPRRIEALARTGRRFVSVAAGGSHALALTVEGDLYGWGDGNANGHGCEEHTPHRVDALIGERVKLMDAQHNASCAVTESGELFTWSSSGSFYNLGHGVTYPQSTPKRVDVLSWARVAAVAIGSCHTLAADEDGRVWAFGQRSGLGLDFNPDGWIPQQLPFMTWPTPISKVRVPARKSPDVLPVR